MRQYHDQINQSSHLNQLPILLHNCIATITSIDRFVLSRERTPCYSICTAEFSARQSRREGDRGQPEESPKEVKWSQERSFRLPLLEQTSLFRGGRRRQQKQRCLQTVFLSQYGEIQRWGGNIKSNVMYFQVENFKRRLSSSSFSSSSYLEMRPRVREESYMKMDEFLGASEDNGSDGLSSSLTSIWRETKKKEETCPGSLSLSKLFKKGNRHKNDYVYVDFEKDNYVDMSNHKCISNKKWKSLTQFNNKQNVDS